MIAIIFPIQFIGFSATPYLFGGPTLFLHEKHFVSSTLILVEQYGHTLVSVIKIYPSFIKPGLKP